MEPAGEEAKVPRGTANNPRFAHESEREFAKLLTYYRIRWEYEPRTFVLDRDDSGDIEVAFTPDFFLPDYDLYIELTTRKPNLMQRKQRKVEELEKQYPGVTIKLMDRSDIQLLVKKIAARSSAWEQ